MPLVDSNQIIRAYLVTQPLLTALIGGVNPRIYCPRLPDNVTLPAISFNTRGGMSNATRTNTIIPSVQFTCWDDDPIDARVIYNKLYDALQGIQYTLVVVGLNTYYILGAEEEVIGQDIQDEVPGYFKVLTFFQIMIQE